MAPENCGPRGRRRGRSRPPILSVSPGPHVSGVGRAPVLGVGQSGRHKRRFKREAPPVAAMDASSPLRRATQVGSDFGLPFSSLSPSPPAARGAGRGGLVLPSPEPLSAGLGSSPSGWLRGAGDLLASPSDPKRSGSGIFPDASDSDTAGAEVSEPGAMDMVDLDELDELDGSVGMPPGDASVLPRPSLDALTRANKRNLPSVAPKNKPRVRRKKDSTIKVGGWLMVMVMLGGR